MARKRVDGWVRDGWTTPRLTDFLAISTVVERMTLDEDIFDGMAGEYAQAPATAANWIVL